MNDVDATAVAHLIGGFWNASDARIGGMVRWLNTNRVARDAATKAITALADQYDDLPSVRQLGTKLAELGASTGRPPLGVGHPAVMERMKRAILEGPYGHAGAREVAARAGVALEARLYDERRQAAAELSEATTCDLGDADWYRDRVRAYDELLAESGG